MGVSEFLQQEVHTEAYDNYIIYELYMIKVHWYFTFIEDVCVACVVLTC